MSSTQCLPWLNVCLCLIHWCLQKDFLPWPGHTCGRHHCGDFLAPANPRSGFDFLFPKKCWSRGLLSLMYHFLCSALKVSEQIPASHCLPEKPTFPSFWETVSSESNFPPFPSLWRGNNCDQTALSGSARDCPAEPWPLSWDAPCFSRKLQPGDILSGFKNYAGGSSDDLNLNIKCLSRGRLQVRLLVD